MRHKVAGKKLNRSTNHRRNMLKTMTEQFLREGKLTTTIAKAKVIKPIVEKLITKGKKGGLHIRRQIIAKFFDSALANKFVDEIAPKYADVSGGMIKMLRLGRRKGDNVMMVKLTLDNPTIKKEVKKVSEKQPKAKAVKTKTAALKPKEQVKKEVKKESKIKA